MPPTFKNISGIALFTLLAYFSWLMWKTIVLHIALKPDTGFLQLKQAYLHIDIWRVAFYIHVFTSLFALLAGFTQFSKSFLKSRPMLHQKIGYVYVLNILFITGPAGLIMSFFANGGITSRTGFIILSILWIYFTAMALFKAIKKRIYHSPGFHDQKLRTHTFYNLITWLESSP